MTHRVGDPVLVVRRADHGCRRLGPLVRLSHGHRSASGSEHLDVVLRIAEGDDLRCVDAEVVAGRAQGVALAGRARRKREDHLAGGADAVEEVHAILVDRLQLFSNQAVDVAALDGRDPG